MLIRESIKGLLSARGFKITMACEGVTAFRGWEKFKENEPNWLLGSRNICSHCRGPATLLVIDRWLVGRIYLVTDEMG